jgi:hypothetical protein
MINSSGCLEETSLRKAPILGVSILSPKIQSITPSFDDATA